MTISFKQVKKMQASVYQQKLILLPFGSSGPYTHTKKLIKKNDKEGKERSHVPQ
jgi:hypothetical protein